MRSYEERCAEVKRRIAAEKRKKRLRRGRLVMAAAAAACLVLLAGVSIVMPGMTAQLQPDSCTGFETAANMYGGSDVLGIYHRRTSGFPFGCVHDHPVLPSAADGAEDAGKTRDSMELIENLLQLLVTFAGACIAGFAHWKSRAQKYFLLFCFYGCFALGALYWTLYLLLFSTTPRVFYVSEFGWVASMIFLRILQATLVWPGRNAPSAAGWHGWRRWSACRCWCSTAPMGISSPT